MFKREGKMTQSENQEIIPVEPQTKKGTTINNSKTALIISIVAIILGGFGLCLGWLAYNQSDTPITFSGSGTDGNSTNFTDGSIADVAAKVSSSVVSIVTSVKTTNFFGQSSNSSAAGTGIIVSSDGYILTNKHVISEASTVAVITDDGTTYEDVEIVATDPLNDVAFLKVKDASNLSVATLGDSKTISVGQQVIAIGNALGEYQNTVTSGIISGTGRSVTASDGTNYNTETLTDMIQTDAAINSGNSGGPLVNAAGEVIGINTATSTSAENMGFAIPISSVKGMLSQLLETGKAERAYLGVYSSEITPDAAKAYNLPVSAGAYLYSSSTYSAIISGGPADKAGLKDKDIVTAVNGVKVGASGSLSNLIGEYKPGDTVQLTVIRDGSERAVNVTLEGYSNK
jgi:serine protease Do